MATKEQIFPKEALGNKEIDLERDYIKISAYNSQGIDYKAFSSIDAYSFPSTAIETCYFYYPENSIRDETIHSYSNIESGIIGTLEGVKSVITSIANNFQQARGMRLTVGSQPDMILNDSPVFFQKTEKRKFDIILNLYATSTVEEDIYDALLFFKKYSHSTLLDRGSKTSFTKIRLPGTFTITGGMFNHPALGMAGSSNSASKHLILLNMTTEYATEIKIRDPNGYPIEAQLTLSFEELAPRFRSDWEGKSPTTSLSSSGK